MESFLKIHHTPKIDRIKKKILSHDELKKHLAIWDFKKFKVVFTNGCFDILHRGHIEYLVKASEMGDIFIIGLNSDASVKLLKGDERPLQDQDSRAIILASLSFVTRIVIFDEETPYNLINLIQPDILVKGGDYKPKDIVGYDIVKTKGGKVLTIPFKEGYSTTGLIKKIKKL